MFTPNQEKLNETRAPYLREPCIVQGRLTDVNADKISTTKETDTINFVVEVTEEGPHKGKIYRHAYFKPDNEESAGKMATAIAHILSMYSGGTPEEASAKASAAIEAGSWEEFRTKVLNVFNDRIGKARYSAKILTWKFTGYITTEGNARFGFTVYPGFVANEASKSMPSFSTKELQGNAKYLQALAAQTGASGSSTPSGDTAAEWGGSTTTTPTETASSNDNDEAPF